MEPLSSAASVIAVIQLTGTIAHLCGTYIGKVRHAEQDIIRLQQNIRSLTVVLEAFDKHLHEPNGSELRTSQKLSSDVAFCFATLTTLKKQIDPGITQKPMRKLGLRALKWPLKRTEVEKAVNDIEACKALFTFALEVDQTMTTSLLSQKVDLSRLQIAKGAAYNDYDNQHTECLPGTRVEVLRDIDNWAKKSDGKCIFWLNGMAGTGKSTVSQTIAHRLKGVDLLGASFFFKRGEQDRGNAKMLFPTLAKQLITTIPPMLPGIRKAIEDDPEITEKVLREQFEKLILQPLLAIKGSNAIMVIIIDALDECDQEESIRVILRLLPQVKKSSSVQLRFLLTSRPELPIRLGFEALADDYQGLILHKTPKSVIERDIKLYFEERFSQLRQERSFSLDWPGDMTIKTLVDRAVPLFISATTLYRFISDDNWNPQKRLKSILIDQTNYVSKMDSTYMPVLNQLLIGQNEQESQQLVQEFKDIVGVIILLATPISVNTIAQLLNSNAENIQIRLNRLHSVLDVPTELDKPVRIIHLSFRDFLLDEKKENRFWINEKEVHQKLTTRCIEVMRHGEHGLRKNICNLQNDGTQRSEVDKNTIAHYLRPELQYACRYWVQHMLQSPDPDNELIQVFSFLKVHFLHWMEAMSLLGIISELFGILKGLQSIIQNDSHPDILEFLNDARRFVLKNRQIIDTAPLQIYSSGLIFVPQASVMRKLFYKEVPSWLYQLPKVKETWGAQIQILEDHSDSVCSVAFSPNGQLLASGSSDKTVKLWDPITGELQQTLTGHLHSVESVSFSPDSQLLASGSLDKTIRLWDPTTGELLQTLGDHSYVLSIAFSPGGQLLASGSIDKTINLWNPITGELQQTLIDHLDSVRSVSFSPNGQLLASGSSDKTVKLWDPITGKLQQTLTGHLHSVESVSFSPDGQLLASGSFDKAIRLWDPTTGELLQTLEGHSDPLSSIATVESVAFSPDSQLLASGSLDKTIRLWDPTTGELLQTLEGHSDPLSSIATVHSVAFSPDSKLLASGSFDKTIRLWDPTASESQQILESHSDSVRSIAFSPNGQLLASGSSDNNINLWDPATGELRQTLKGHSKWVWSVVFSSNSQLVVSSSDDRTIKIWDSTTGELWQTLKGHSHSVRCVIFSPNGQLLASGSGDSTIKLWDPITGELQHTLKGHTDWVWSISFSPNNKLLASGSSDKTVKLWNSITGELQQTLEGHSGSIRSVSFSSNGQLLVSSSDDTTIKLWDPTTGELRQTLENHYDIVQPATNGDVSIQDNQWICIQGRKKLWLPSEYRPICFAIKDGVLALGHASGRVSFISCFA